VSDGTSAADDAWQNAALNDAMKNVGQGARTDEVVAALGVRAAA